MKIILKKDVANLGDAGEIVEVKTGYARNYLVPQGFAVVGTASAIKQHEETIRQRAHKEAKLVADAEALAAKISAVEVPVTVKVNEDGKIFGTVTTQNISDALAAQEINIDKKVITLVEPIKQVGEYTAQARLHREVKADIKLNVVAAE